MVSTVFIAKNVYGGDGIGRLGDGRVVFVPGAWAGEQVRAELVEEKKHFVKARLVEVVEPSPDRLPQPSTSSSPVVPGMVYAGLSYAGEVKSKEAQLRDFFERARLPFPSPSPSTSTFPLNLSSPSTFPLNLSSPSPSTFPLNLSSPSPSTSTFPLNLSSSSTLNLNLSPLHYRNKVVYHFAQQKGAWAIGYRVEPSHEIVDVTEDPLARPEINAALPEIRKAVLTLLTQGPKPVRQATAAKENVTVRWSARTGVKWWIGKAPDNVIIKETTLGHVFEVPAGGFYQMNPEVGEALVKAVVDAYGKDLAAAPDLLDLYCGVGVFGLSCAKAAANLKPKLIGVESGRQAIDFAKRNAAAIGCPEAKFFAEEVGRNMRRIPIGAKTTVIVDPPRDGLEKGVAAWLAASRAPRIFYVSCDPATLVRDLRELVKAYDIVSVSWFNMFPRTARFETFVALQKRG